MQEIKKVVILGPESTGKSTLCRELATHYNTVWCEEYARRYLLEHGINYTYNDLLVIAEGQLLLEETAIEQVKNAINKNSLTASPLLFVDTNMYVMKVWCDFVFGKCHEFITKQTDKRNYDLYLLCNTDLPWVKDELREYPDLKTRDQLYDIYKNILENQQVPWVNVSGTNEQRTQIAISAVDRLLRTTI